MSLWKRKDGRGKTWQLTRRVDTGDGTRMMTVSTGCSDRRAALEVERRVDQLVNCRQSGLPLDPDLLVWVERIPERLRQSLIRQGVIAADGAAYAKSVADHVADYTAWCRFKGQSKVHVSNKRTQLQRFIGATGVRRLTDIQRGLVNRYLQQLKATGKSHRTINQHQTTLVSFLNWCVNEESRLVHNPLLRMPRLNESLDRRRTRRAATTKEMEALLASVPPYRRTVYLVAAMTGLRRGELKALRVGDVDLRSGVLVVRPEVSKNRGRSELPLHPQVIEALRQHIPVAAEPGDRLFEFLPRVQTFHRDLDAAGIDRFDEQGRQLDMHALRKTFATWLLRSGVAPSKAKLLTRHRSVQVLEKHYDGLGCEDAADAIGRLAAIGLPETKATARDVVRSADHQQMTRSGARPDATTPVPDEEPVDRALRAGPEPRRAAPGAARAVPSPSRTGAALRQNGEGEPTQGAVGRRTQPRYTSRPSVDWRDPSRIGDEKRRKSQKDNELRAVGAVG